MFNSKSIYALNKADKMAVVYPSAKGPDVRLTAAAFDSDEAFQLFKEMSDEDYHQVEKEEHIYYDHTCSMSNLSGASTSAPSPEEILALEQEERQLQQKRKRLCAKQMIAVRGCLTDKQYRRLWLYHVDRLSGKEIAKVEKVSEAAISESISTANKNISKNFHFTPQTP